jgi:hypothetical protein
MEHTLEDIFDVVEAHSSPSFSPGPVSIPSPPSTTKSGRKYTPRKRKAPAADDVALVSPPVKAARNQLTAAEIRHNRKLQLGKNIFVTGVVFIFGSVELEERSF